MVGFPKSCWPFTSASAAMGYGWIQNLPYVDTKAHKVPATCVTRSKAILGRHSRYLPWKVCVCAHLFSSLLWKVQGLSQRIFRVCFRWAKCVTLIKSLSFSNVWVSFQFSNWSMHHYAISRSISFLKISIISVICLFLFSVYACLPPCTYAHHVPA